MDSEEQADARGIVVKGIKQGLVCTGIPDKKGIDYDEVFATSAPKKANPTVFGFVLFLYGLSGFEDPYFPKPVYRVLKALNGLSSSTFEPDSRDTILVQVYVDDIIFGSTNKAWCDAFEELMKGEFEMSAMGEMTFFLGLQVKQLPDGLFISQDKRLISWQCKKQTIVATSSTEAEYVAAASCCAQVLWIQNQLLDYGFNFMNTKIFIDNQSTICIVKNPVFHQRTKHIEIRHHFIRDANEKNLIQVLKIHTNDNVADLLTKAFDGPRFEYLVVHIGMVDMIGFCWSYYDSAGSYPFCWTIGFCWSYFVSAGSYGLCCWFRVHAGGHTSAGGFISADRVYVPAVCMVSAVGGLFLLAEYIHAAGVVYAANTSIHAAGLVCAGSIMFLLADLFLLVVTCFCCAQLDIAGRLVSATSHLVSAGSIQSCWWHNVSAA
ncbi:putative ribonuclease H-like domain-containing protein [Tanacetum coccineum]|uniref:Ribonuclease H-like domain-containing protein n=1 Tax=Tanacetum coccineum TaxID=301880 RepID=A0ABQ4WJV0_9ASTR